MQTTTKDFLLWGHSLDQYRSMFGLSQHDLKKHILECASGFASFNAEMYKEGKKEVSCDPAYELSPEKLKKHLLQGLESMLVKVEENPDKFGRDITSAENLKKQTGAMMAEFLADFPQGKKEGRYIAAALPKLPFSDNQFELALCAYFLFSSKELSLPFHIAAIKEMCRVAGEARIYPLIDEEGEPAALLPIIMLELQQQNYGLEIKEVPYEFQKGGNAMLRVWSQSCEI